MEPVPTGLQTTSLVHEEVFWLNFSELICANCNARKWKSSHFLSCPPRCFPEALSSSVCLSFSCAQISVCLQRDQGVDGGVCSLSVCGLTLIKTHKERADNTECFLFVQEWQCHKDKRRRALTGARKRESGRMSWWTWWKIKTHRALFLIPSWFPSEFPPNPQTSHRYQPPYLWSLDCIFNRPQFTGVSASKCKANRSSSSVRDCLLTQWFLAKRRVFFLLLWTSSVLRRENKLRRRKRRSLHHSPYDCRFQPS